MRLERCCTRPGGQLFLVLVLFPNSQMVLQVSAGGHLFLVLVFLEEQSSLPFELLANAICANILFGVVWAF